MARPKAWYCTREHVKYALDVIGTARDNDQVDRAIGSGAEAIDGLCKRRFFPWTGTRYFNWPNHQYARPWRLWLDDNDLISVTTLVAGGVVIPSTNYFLEPVNSGPPFTHIEIDISKGSAFAPGATWQRAIAITGLWGHSADEVQVGALTTILGGAVDAAASISWTTPRFGVGDILRVDSERMIVGQTSMVDSTQDTAGSLTASSSDMTILVADGTKFAEGETILVDSERMRIDGIAGNSLTVKRAWDGTVLASHNSSASVFTLTGVDLDRAQLGTSIASHATDAAVFRHRPPDLVRDLNIAEALNQLQLEASAYARVIGEGENAREGTGRSLFDLRRDVVAAFGRKARARAV